MGRRSESTNAHLSIKRGSRPTLLLQKGSRRVQEGVKRGSDAEERGGGDVEGERGWAALQEGGN
eukprot:1121752-Pyramimonas_sp.AAC.1